MATHQKLELTWIGKEKRPQLEPRILLEDPARSYRGAQFRRWATDLLKAYLTEGVALDDARFKNGEDAAYFERLLPYLNSKRTSLTTWCLPQ
jgi:hypothetical protein